MQHVSFKVIFCSALICVSSVTLCQTPADVAQKRESLIEMETDLAILEARLKNNRAEYTIPNVCGTNVRLAEPILTTRKNYCNQKATEFNTRDADLKAQWQKLSESIRQLDSEIRQMESQRRK